MNDSDNPPPNDRTSNNNRMIDHFISRNPFWPLAEPAPDAPEANENSDSDSDSGSDTVVDITTVIDITPVVNDSKPDAKGIGEDMGVRSVMNELFVPLTRGAATAPGACPGHRPPLRGSLDHSGLNVNNNNSGQMMPVAMSRRTRHGAPSGVPVTPGR